MEIKRDRQFHGLRRPLTENSVDIGKEIWTVGYQKWPSKDRWSGLLAALKGARIEILCDIRHSPCSSSLDPANSYGPRNWHLQAGDEGIAGSLAKDGIDYRWIVELGNPQKNDPAIAVLTEHLSDPSGRWPVARGLIILREIIESGKRCCLMCACQRNEECHRKPIAEALSGISPPSSVG